VHVQVWSFNVDTGGPWALAQLASALRDAGHQASVTLPGESVPGGVDVVVAPEIALSALCAVRGPLRVLWWLSVDNAYWCRRRDQLYDLLGPRLLDRVDAVARRRTYATLREPAQRDILHAAQSEFARAHVREVLGTEPLMLTDYLTDLPALTAPVETGARERRVAYNPAKGLPATSRVISELNGAVDFVPIKGLTHAGTVQLLRRSLVYLDLGSHPGRDRLPREAALAGCIVLAGLRGAAVNAIDMPIPDDYKLPVPWRRQDAGAAAARIRAVSADPAAHLPRMEHAVQEILRQESTFRREVDGLVTELHRRLEANSAGGMRVGGQ
jgi:hypothetical protein